MFATGAKKTSFGPEDEGAIKVTASDILQWTNSERLWEKLMSSSSLHIYNIKRNSLTSKDTFVFISL